MTNPNPLDYRPIPPRDPKTLKNFGWGLLIGFIASGIGWGIAFSIGNLNIFLYILGILVVAKIGAAIALELFKPRPGFASGILVSMGLIALIAGGLCFATFQIKG